MYMELDTMDILSTMMLFYGQAKLKTSKMVEPSLLEAMVPKSLFNAVCQIGLLSTINPGSNLRFLYLTILAPVASKKYLMSTC